MQRQAMGVALHIVLLPFLNYCIAQLIRTTPTYKSRLFFASQFVRSTLKGWQCEKGGENAYINPTADERPDSNRSGSGARSHTKTTAHPRPAIRPGSTTDYRSAAAQIKKALFRRGLLVYLISRMSRRLAVKTPSSSSGCQPAGCKGISSRSNARSPPSTTAEP